MGMFDRMKQTVSETAVSLQSTATSNLISTLKPQIIKQAANINYNTVSSSLKVLDNVSSVPKSVILSIDLLQKAADEHKQSDQPNKDDEFLYCLVNNIDAELILATLEPIVKLIPCGNAIVIVLRLIVNYKKK